MNRYLIIKRRALFADGWTYGDWRQYVAWRDDGSACLVRMSNLPLFASLVGVFFLLAAGCGTWLKVEAPDAIVGWGKLFGYACLGFALVAPLLITWLTQWRLCVIVGRAVRRADGSYWRAD